MLLLCSIQAPCEGKASRSRQEGTIAGNSKQANSNLVKTHAGENNSATSEGSAAGAGRREESPKEFADSGPPAILPFTGELGEGLFQGLELRVRFRV